MADLWEEKLTCAIACSRCQRKMSSSDERILSVYDHEPICMPCKREEEKRSDYADVSKECIGRCMAETEVMWGDPKGYCYHHFYAFRCK